MAIGLTNVSYNTNNNSSTDIEQLKNLTLDEIVSKKLLYYGEEIQIHGGFGDDFKLNKDVIKQLTPIYSNAPFGDIIIKKSPSTGIPVYYVKYVDHFLDIEFYINIITESTLNRNRTWRLARPWHITSTEISLLEVSQYFFTGYKYLSDGDVITFSSTLNNTLGNDIINELNARFNVNIQGMITIKKYVVNECDVYNFYVEDFETGIIYNRTYNSITGKTGGDMWSQWHSLLYK